MVVHCAHYQVGAGDLSILENLASTFMCHL